jgi:NAD(P)-dependent dehydrogenase (short-subunit alcohol dehydrogenase family)
MNMQDFEGKVAVVTGAASGIGRALAERFANEGMRVVLADVEEPALETAVRELTQAEHEVIGVQTDVSKRESVEELARQAIDAFGKVHVLCNNAGVGGGRGLMWEMTLNDWEWTFGVNFWGVLHGIRTFVPLMLSHGEEGHIVNTASMAGITPGGGPYGVTKHAVVALSEGLYLNLRMVQAKIGASVLCPGWVHTNILDSARNRPPELQNPDEPPPTEFEQAIRARVQESVDGGLPPADVAGVVVDGIREGRFWITTTHEFDDVIRSRTDGIFSGRGPEIRIV